MVAPTPPAGSLYFCFQEEKAVDAVAVLLKRHGPGMTRLVLLKLLYFAEREAVTRHNRPICGGQYVAMDNGPVLSEVYNLIKGERSSARWTHHISSDGNDVNLVGDLEPGAISDAEIDVLTEVCDEWSGQHLDDILAHAHYDFEEWQDPHGASVKIPAVALLRAVGKTEEDIRDIADEVRVENHYEHLFAL